MTTTMTEFVHKKVASPVGLLTLVASESALAAILWENDDPDRVRIDHGEVDEQNPILLETEKQLLEFYSGQRQNFDLPIEFKGTAFQKSVWRALLNIPYGETKTYKQVAVELGKEQAVRAVGTAIGKNPISIIAPCHRVIGTDGNLRGFAGGLEAKAKLLEHESSTKQIKKR